MSSMATQVQTYIRARYPLLYIVSCEELRVERALIGVADSLKMDIAFWSVTQGFTDMKGQPKGVGAEVSDPLTALREVEKQQVRSLIVMRDLHRWLQPEREDNLVLRHLRDLARQLRMEPPDVARTVVLLSPVLALPPELEKDVTVVRWPLPNREDLALVLAECAEAMPVELDLFTGTSHADIVDAALGLTTEEASNVFARSVVEHRRMDVKLVASEKEQVIAKDGVLQWVSPLPPFEDVAGIETLKAWLQVRRKGFTPAARAFGIDSPRGVLIVGPGGTGKSLLAKAIGSAYGMPVLRMDPDRAKSKWVGDSGHRFEGALETAQAVAPVVLWLDEVDKGFRVSDDTEGVEVGMLGTFLTWMQERPADKPPVFVVACANRIEAIPDEFTRKGRFDEIFFVDLPNAVERTAIFDVHLRKRGRDWGDGSGPLRSLGVLRDAVAATHNFSGAEIEAVVVSALYTAFFEGERALTERDLVVAAKDTVPAATAKPAGIKAMREAAKMWVRASANSPSEALAAAKGGRKIL